RDARLGKGQDQRRRHLRAPLRPARADRPAGRLTTGRMRLASAAGLAALRHRDFSRYLAASFLATGALAMQSVALGWQIYDLTGSPFDLGLVGLMEFLPPFCLALVTGHIADRFDRRLILALGLFAELAAALAMVLMVVLDSVSVFGILAVAFAF